MKKITLMILIVIILQIFLPLLTILDNSIFVITSQAETDYSSIDLNTLEEIKDNPEALSQVCNISVTSNTSSDNEKIMQQLGLIRLCPNVENISIAVNGLNLDKTFFNSLSSTKDINITIQWGNINFEGINNSNITSLSIDESRVYNFFGLTNLTNLRELIVSFVDGFSTIDFDKLEKLERILLLGERIENYEEFFTKIRHVKELSLESCNLQNSDTSFLKKVTNLQNINLHGTYVSDIAFLKELSKLKAVTLPLGITNLEVLYDMPYLELISFDGYTETNIDNNLVNFFEENNISYPDFDRNIKNKVQTIIEEFNFAENTSEYEKIEKVTEYVLQNMEANGEKLGEIKRSGASGQATTLDLDINFGCGACHHYAILEYTLLKLVDIDAYYVAGYAPSPGDNLPGPHAWNMVNFDENWYGIDAMWIDDDYSDPTTPEYKSNYQWRKYYLKNTKIDDLDDWPEYDDSEEYIDKYFALYHRTFNNPQDIITNRTIVTDISVTTFPTKKQYIQNYENLDLIGGILTVTYNNGTTDTISLTNENINISGFDNTKIGTNTITVEYEGRTTTFDVQIVSKQPVEIEVTTLPTKNQYIQNYENLDVTGGIITIVYNDKSTDNIDMTNEHVKVSNFDNTVLGKNTITIEYNGIKTNIDVEIISKSVTKIELTERPIKTKYIQNTEMLDLTGGVLKVTYNDKTTDTISMKNENVKVTGFNNSSVGNNTLTIEYEGTKISFIIEIIQSNTEESKKEDTSSKDNTVSDETLPNTGRKNIMLIICITVSAILAIVLYKKYQISI